MGRGVFELGNHEGRGGSSSFGNPDRRGGQKTYLTSGGWTFSGTTYLAPTSTHHPLPLKDT